MVPPLTEENRAEASSASAGVTLITFSNRSLLKHTLTRSSVIMLSLVKM